MNLRTLEGIRRLDHFPGLWVHVVMPLGRTRKSIGVVQSCIEPLRGIRCRHLPGQHVAQLVIKGRRVFLLVEITVTLSPVSPAAGHPVEDLARIMLASQHRLSIWTSDRLPVWSKLGDTCLAEIFLRQNVNS